MNDQCETSVVLLQENGIIRDSTGKFLGRLVDDTDGLIDKHRNRLLDRIQNYLESGGLFNPELMEHDKVRNLVMDLRDYLQKLRYDV